MLKYPIICLNNFSQKLFIVPKEDAIQNLSMYNANKKEGVIEKGIEIFISLISDKSIQFAFSNNKDYGVFEVKVKSIEQGLLDFEKKTCLRQSEYEGTLIPDERKLNNVINDYEADLVLFAEAAKKNNKNYKNVNN